MTVGASGAGVASGVGAGVGAAGVEGGTTATTGRWAGRTAGPDPATGWNWSAGIGVGVVAELAADRGRRDRRDRGRAGQQQDHDDGRPADPPCERLGDDQCDDRYGEDRRGRGSERRTAWAIGRSAAVVGQ